MTDLLTLLYRGPLASCNFSCSYCPFATRLATAAEPERRPVGRTEPGDAIGPAGEDLARGVEGVGREGPNGRSSAPDRGGRRLLACNRRATKPAGSRASLATGGQPVGALDEDRRALRRLVNWAACRTEPLAVFFTPWGEALIHAWYQEAIVELAALPHLRKVAIQTNLSPPLDWLAGADTTRVGIWATYHPRHVERRRFLRRCAELERRGVSFSVGAVGLPALVDEIEALRAALPEHIYVWINAAKRDPCCADEAFVRRLTAIDPHFGISLRPQRSLGLPCRAGHSVVSVDGAGRVRRCHFLPEVIGHLDEPDLARRLSPAPSPCPADECRCHIGYVHLVPLGLDRVFGDGILERALPRPR